METFGGRLHQRSCALKAGGPFPGGAGAREYYRLKEIAICKGMENGISRESCLSGSGRTWVSGTELREWRKMKMERYGA